jgi:hypothetical protein
MFVVSIVYKDYSLISGEQDFVWIINAELQREDIYILSDLKSLFDSR